MIRASWLLPVRDGGALLGEALASAWAQTGPRDELVLVDDGSTDGAPQALLQRPPYAEDPRVRLLRQPPRGIAAALERGRAACRGRWIARLDADDRALPGRLDAQIAALESAPRLAAIGGQARVERPDGEVPEGMRRYVCWVNNLVDLHAELLVESPLFHPAVTLRAQALDAVGGWRSGDFPEDYELWLRLAAAGWRLEKLDRPVLLIRDRPDRLTRSDPRYRREAFDRVRRDYLRATALDRPRRVALWGGGKTGRRWLRWLLEEGHEVPAVLDLAGAGHRRGVPVRPPEALAGLEVDLLLFAVGVRGARAQAREAIAQLKPDWREGERWFALR